MRPLLCTIVLAAAGPLLSQTFVRVDGKDLIAPNGSKLFLKGINLGNWLVPEGYMWKFDEGPASPREIESLLNQLAGPSDAKAFWAQWREWYITAEDVRLIATAGFNSVRVPFHYKFIDDPEGFRLLDRLIQWCHASGLWVILDMHCAPGGQTGANIDDSWGYPFLFESEADQADAARLWRKIAEHYRDEPVVLGYDLLNEPLPHFGNLPRYNAQLEPLYKRITAAIREVDPNHIVILGGAQWDSNFDVFGPPFDSKLVYTFHKYWTAPTRDVIAPYLAFRERYNVPVWMGESGENTNDWIRTFRSTLESNEVGWAFWPYKKMDATSSVASYGRPLYWDEIVAYARLPGGTGAAEERLKSLPALDHSRAALADLLNRIRIANCAINSGYLSALGMNSNPRLAMRRRPIWRRPVGQRR